eukprot:PhM_4_TR13919/c0_g1_i2/m.40044
MLRIGRRYMSFRDALMRLHQFEDDDATLRCFSIQLLEHEDVSGQTLEQYLCLLDHELRLQGITFNPQNLSYLKRAMRRKATEVQRAPPLNLEALLHFLR